MPTKDIPLELIDDNPYNPRKHYPPGKVREMAQSLQEHGLQQTPKGRAVNGRFQLAFGHMRKRAYLYNLKKDGDSWKEMPVNIEELSDQKMFDLAMEENLRRTDITPIETARCILSYSEVMPEVLDEEIARKHCMTAANVSNMKRVLRLPEKILEKIDAGKLSFTQGRELLVLEELENGDNLMKVAIDGLKTGTKYYGEPNTVEGLQRSIHSVISNHYRPIDKEFAGHRWDLLFDTRAAGCLQCEKMIRAHPTKSKAAHYCRDEECWDRHDNEHREKAAAEAKARMEEDILQRTAAAAKPVAADFTLEKRGTSWIALDSQGVVIAIADGKTSASEIAYASFEPVATEVNPGTYTLNHTYRFCEKPGSRTLEYSDITAQDLATAAKALGVEPANIEQVKVYKSSGKLGTGGGVSAGWSKCAETLADISQEMPEEPPDETCATAEELQEMEADATAKADKSFERANAERPVGELPCETCLRGKTCDRSFFYTSPDNSGRLLCRQWQSPDSEQKELSRRIASAPAPAPDDILEKAKAAAGTRAEVLDLRPLHLNGQDWRQELKEGYVNLSQVIEELDDPGECLERCTEGFHFAFDSKYLDRGSGAVCTNPKCVTKKKTALTRARNAAGNARKKAEAKAIKQAIAETTTLDRPRIKLILLAQMNGQHTNRGYYGGNETKQPATWLWHKVSAGTPEHERKSELLFQKIDKLGDEELAQLLVEFMLDYLVDRGDVASHQVKTEEPLKWLGLKIDLGG